jgi:hypothetical protein
MNLAERIGRLVAAEGKKFSDTALPSIEETFAGVAKKVGNFLDALLTEAERSTLGEEPPNEEGAPKEGKAKAQRQSQQSPQNPKKPPVKPTPPAAKPHFTEFRDFTTAFEGVKSGKLALGDHQVLKLIDAAQERGFIDKLRGWVSKSGNSETILIPLTSLLLTPTSDEKLHDRIFYRIHQLGLQEELLKWMVSGPNASLRLTDTLGAEYAGFNAQLRKRVISAVGPAEKVDISDEEARKARLFAVRVQSELMEGGR